MYKYDDSGLLIEMTDYDTHEKVHANSSGIARFAYSYNEKRQLVKTEYFGVNDEPVNDGEGVHMILISYDAFGRKNNEIKKSALGYVIGESKSSATTTRQIRDSKNRVIEDGTYDQHNQLAANSEGFAMVRYEYDESGNITAFRYYDANGKLVNRRGIGAIIRKKYDSQKNVTEEAYFDANDRPVISHEYGAAKGKVKYDQAGRMIDLAAFDPQNKPMEGLGGFARKHWIFDSTGKESETDYYDRFGVLILRQTAKNDYYPSEASRVFLRNLGKSVSILVAELSGETDSTAKKVHIHVGDVLLSYDGVNYDGKSIASALEWIKGFEVGPDRMRKLEILRDGKKLVLQVPRGKLGVRLVDAKID
jgi:hypothetical protein